MALSGNVFHLQYVPWVQQPIGPVSDSNLHLTRQHDDVLDARSVVPITEAPIREPAIGHFGSGFEGDGFGIAFRQRDEALAEQFNEALAELQEDGTYDEIYARYFGEE